MSFKPWTWPEPAQVSLAFLTACVVTASALFGINRALDGNIRGALGVDVACQSDRKGNHDSILHQHLCRASVFSSAFNASRSSEDLPDSTDMAAVSDGPPSTALVGSLLYGSPTAGGVGEATALLQYLERPVTTVEAVFDSIAGATVTRLGIPEDQSSTQLLAELIGGVRDGLNDRSTSFVWRRYLNGAIQYWSMVLAGAGLILLLLSHLPLAIRERLILQNQSIGVTNLWFEYKGENPEDAQRRYQSWLKGISTLPQNAKKEPPSFVIDVVHDAALAARPLGRDSHANSAQTLSLAVDQIKSTLDSRMGIVRWIAWAVPSVGFIGTLLGIGTALESAHQVVGQRVGFAQTAAIQLITGKLGTAFDTTLIALIVSLPLMLILHLEGRQRRVHPMGVLGIAPHPDVEIDGGPRNTMGAQRVRTHHQKSRLRPNEFGEDVVKILDHTRARANAFSNIVGGPR